MSLNDPLANALSLIINSERIGKLEVEIKPVSNTITKVIEIMKEHGYVGPTKETDDGRGKFMSIKLTGNINKCGVIKPRHAVSKDNYEKFEKRFLPAQGFGILIVSTPKGIMTQEKAKEQKIGGRLLSYCY